MQRKIGVIDLGSNTTRLIVMAYTPGVSFRLVNEVRETVRLAEGIGADGKLQPAPMARGVAAMALFRRFCESTDVQEIVPAATSAVREATNREDFLARVEREAGLTMRVLSTQEEAYYGYLGAANALDLHNAYVVDIGGGSTQISQVYRRAFGRTTSQPIGALRLTDRYVRSDPISNKDFKALEQAVAERFSGLDWLHERETTGATLAGIGGTIRTLAEMDLKARAYPLDRVHGYSFSLERLEATIEKLRGMTLKERAALPGLGSDRADLILSGATIIRHIMRQGSFNNLTVSGHGLREGLFYEQFGTGESSPLIPDVRGFSVMNLARIYGYEAAHVEKVRELSLSLFDQLQPLHGYGAWERELLSHAATIHDIGVAVAYYDHHKHGFYLIVNGMMLGFSHRELLLIALLVRYHRKGDVNVDEYRDVLLSGDAERVAKLAALLRLAEYLERRKSQVIQSIHVEIGETVRATAQASGDATIEVWDANRRAGLFKKAFGREIEIV